MSNRVVRIVLLLFASMLVHSGIHAQTTKPTLYLVCNAKNGSLEHQFFLELYEEVQEFLSEKRRVAFASDWDDFTPKFGDYAAEVLMTVSQLDGGRTDLYTVAIIVNRSTPCSKESVGRVWEYQNSFITTFTDHYIDAKIRSLRKDITDVLPR